MREDAVASDHTTSRSLPRLQESVLTIRLRRYLQVVAELFHSLQSKLFNYFSLFSLFPPVLVLSSGRPAATRSNALRINGTIEPVGPSLNQRAETTPTTAITTAAASCGYKSFELVAPMRSAMVLANSLCADADALRTSP